MKAYILGLDGKPVPEPDIMKWARWYEESDSERIVARTPILDGDAHAVDVSTVFLGLDHRLDGDGPPLLYETMIFGGEYDGRQWRYSTLAEAVQGHHAAVKLVQTNQE